jgi:hypothetical protein
MNEPLPAFPIVAAQAHADASRYIIAVDLIPLPTLQYSLRWKSRGREALESYRSNPVNTGVLFLIDKACNVCLMKGRIEFSVFWLTLPVPSVIICQRNIDIVAV